MPDTANAGLVTFSEGRDEAAVLASVAVDGPYTGPAPAPAPAPRPAARRWRRNRGWYRLISPVAVVALWQLLSSAGLIPADKLPPPTTVWHTAVSLVTTNSPAYGTLQGAMLVSLQRMAIGFAVGGTIAVLLALVAGLSRLGENAVDPLLQIVRMLPLFGLIPVFIVWFGIGELPKIILIALGAAIPLYLNTFAGIRSVDAKLAEVGRVHLAESTAALADPNVQRRLADIGQQIYPREQQTPQALAVLQKAEIEKWWPIIKAAGIKAE